MVNRDDFIQSIRNCDIAIRSKSGEAVAFNGRLEVGCLDFVFDIEAKELRLLLKEYMQKRLKETDTYKFTLFSEVKNCD